MVRTRNNSSSSQETHDLATKMAQMEAKIQQGLDKLRGEYIQQKNSGTSSGQNTDNFEEKLKCFEVTVKKDIEMLKMDIKSLQSEIRHNKSRIEDFMKINNNKKLMFRGIPEDNPQNLQDQIISFIQARFNINISRNEINSCYRLKKRPENNKPAGKRSPVQPVIVEFITQWRRDEIYFAKKQLKGTRFLVCEVLIRPQYDLFLKVREKFKNQAWTAKGNIFVFHNNKKTQITDENALGKL